MGSHGVYSRLRATFNRRGDWPAVPGQRTTSERAAVRLRVTADRPSRLFTCFVWNIWHRVNVVNRMNSGCGGAMGIVERKEREREGVRRKILDAARELFTREGYERV